MKIVNYQGLISLIIVMINDVHSFSAEIKENVTGLLGENGTLIECSYTNENIVKIDSVAFLAFNKSTTTFDTITTYLPDSKTLINTKGQYLEGRVTLKNITQSSTTAAIIFNKLLCIDDTLYKCFVRYLDSDSVGQDSTSNTNSISVQVPPSKPDEILVMQPPEDSTMTTTKSAEYNSTSKEHQTISTLQSVTKNDTIALHFSTPTTGHHITPSSPSVYDTSSKSSHRTTTYYTQQTATAQKIVEGDNITVVCTGDVGKPPAKHVFQKYRDVHTEPVNYTASATSAWEISENCSYYRESNVTFQVTAEDNNAVIRCVVESSLAEPDMFIESDPIEVYYAVRMPTIIAYPNKTEYILGEDTSIHLTCKSDGNPEPSYYWYKENSKEEVRLNENFTITNMNITDSGTYFCKVNNTFIGGTYEAAANVQVKIIHEADKSTTSTSGSTSQPFDTDGKKINWIGDIDNWIVVLIIVIVLVAAVTIVICCCLYKWRTKQNSKHFHIDSSNINLVESQKTTSGEPSNYKDAYEDVDVDFPDGKDKSLSYKETPADVRKHNDEYTKKQIEDKDKEKDNPATPSPAAVYAFVNKPKNTATIENKPPTDQEEDVYADSKEGEYDTSGNNRHKNNTTEHEYDSTANIKKDESDDRDISSAQKSQIGSLNNKSFEKDSDLKTGEIRQVATVNPTVRISSESHEEGHTHTNNDVQSKPNYLNVLPNDHTSLTDEEPVSPNVRSTVEFQGDGQTNENNDIESIETYQNV